MEKPFLYSTPRQLITKLMFIFYSISIGLEFLSANHTITPNYISLFQKLKGRNNTLSIF